MTHRQDQAAIAGLVAARNRQSMVGMLAPGLLSCLFVDPADLQAAPTAQAIDAPATVGGEG